jgi:hypothetical protein
MLFTAKTSGDLLQRQQSTVIKRYEWKKDRIEVYYGKYSVAKWISKNGFLSDS